ncbi:MAG TPA: hypothetical protein VGQ08_08190 [Nitrospiraceae bacterium]|jgi:hypothetical protein|nr:hypothetical protein [Nitrospiraceae bacterium]
MYLLDPDEALSREELLQNTWDVRLTPPMRAKVLAIAQARGCTWQDIFREYFDEYDAMWDDLSEREEMLRTHEEMEGR